MLNTDFALAYDLQLDSDGMATCSVDASSEVTCQEQAGTRDLVVAYAEVTTSLGFPHY